MTFLPTVIACALGTLAGGAALLAIADLVARRRRMRTELADALARSSAIARELAAQQAEDVRRHERRTHELEQGRAAEQAAERERWELEEHERAQLEQLDMAIAHATREHDAHEHAQHFDATLRLQSIRERAHQHLHRAGRPLHPSLHSEMHRRMK